MYISPNTVQVLHEDRLREAQKHYGRDRMARELAEPLPSEVEGGLLFTIKQWMRRDRSQTEQVNRDVRHAHA